MKRQTDNKIVLVVRQTRLNDLVARFGTKRQAKFYVEHMGADFTDYVRESEQYEQSVDQTVEVLSTFGQVQVLQRAFLPNFIFGPQDTVVVLGQDGLVANTVKYATQQQIIGVNPDPKRWDGILVPFLVRELPKVVPEVMAGRRPIKEVTMAKAELNNGQTLYAVNDFFIGVKSHASARYVIRTGGTQEQQSSSGIIISTGLGSTGWLKSLLAGAVAIASNITGQPLSPAQETTFAWDSEFLCFTVREPFPSRSSSASLVFGKITPEQPLNIMSQMAESGVIFSDGIENDFLEFNSGTKATILLAEQKGRLVV